MVQSYPRRRARYFSRSLQFRLARQVAAGRIYNFAPIARLMAMEVARDMMSRGDGVGTIRRNQQVYVVVGHQGVGVKSAMFFFKCFAQPVKIGLIIFFAKEAGFTVMSPLHDMQWAAIKMGAEATGHVAIIAKLIEPGPFNPL